MQLLLVLEVVRLLEVLKVHLEVVVEGVFVSSVIVLEHLQEVEYFVHLNVNYLVQLLEQRQEFLEVPKVELQYLQQFLVPIEWKKGELFEFV